MSNKDISMGNMYNNAEKQVCNGVKSYIVTQEYANQFKYLDNKSMFSIPEKNVINEVAIVAAKLGAKGLIGFDIELFKVEGTDMVALTVKCNEEAKDKLESVRKDGELKI